MNNNKIKIAALALSMALCSSCTDEFLDTMSKTQLDTQTGYVNEATANLALIGCYDGLQQTISGMGAYGFYLASEIASDECVAGAGVTDDKNQSILDLFDMTPAPSYENVLEEEWKNYYAGIFRCNTLINNADIMNFSSDKVKNRILGEARGLRAFMYFDLVRMFGDVPLILKLTTDNLPRTDANKVFEAIFEDLKFAYENIPGDLYNGSNLDQTDGRFSKYAAAALLARAYLFYTGYYQASPKAVDKQYVSKALEDVISNGNYALEDEYKDLWFHASCPEGVVEDDGDDKNYYWKEGTGSYKGKYAIAPEQIGGTISKEIVFNIKCNTTGDYNGNNGGNSILVYLGVRQVTNLQTLSAGWGISNINPEFAKEIKSQTIDRYKASIFDLEEMGVKEETVSSSYEYTGYSIKKYAPYAFSDGTRETVAFRLGEKHMIVSEYRDFTSIRYADVLLMKAELDEGGDAWTTYSAKRADGAAYSKDELKKQRKYEFAFEGIRYWDLLRYGLDEAAEALSKQNGLAVKNGGVDATMEFNVENFKSKKGLFPLPKNQITLSGGTLTQNPGWNF